MNKKLLIETKIKELGINKVVENYEDQILLIIKKYINLEKTIHNKRSYGDKRAKHILKGIKYRCYSNKGLIKDKTYIQVELCEEWKNAQSFISWYNDNFKTYMSDWHLDKDILVKGNKIYSPETCCFVPQELNSLFVKNNKIRGKYPIGVHYLKNQNRYKTSMKIDGKTKYLGTFDTSEEAFQAYKTAKEAYIKEKANYWRPLIGEKVYQAMHSWVVEITD